MALLATKPAIPRIVAFSPSHTRTLSTSSSSSFKPKPRVRSSSTSIVHEKFFPDSTSAEKPPLSALPTPTLLRSLLIATISSKPILLLPSLSFLSFLCKPHSSLLNVDRNPILHAILKATFYNQFCAGESPAEVKATIKRLNGMGFQGTIMTYAKETVFDAKTNTQHGLGVADVHEKGLTQEAFCAHIEAWRKGTLHTVELLGENDYLAVKLTGAGPAVTEAFSAGSLPPAQMLNALDEICTAAKHRGCRILVDAESHHFLSGILRVTLDLMRKFNTDGYARIYNTYQAYLKSTPATIDRHLQVASEEGFTLGLKLVRGAYIASDERCLIHDTKSDTDGAYNGIAQGALKQELGSFGQNGKPFPAVNLFLASHNKESVLSAHSLHQHRLEHGLPTVPVGYAQLHGMSDEVSFKLLQLKNEKGDPMVYKCSTWGGLGECLAYLLRRAVENRDAVGRTGDEYRALKGEVKRRVKSFFRLY